MRFSGVALGFVSRGRGRLRRTFSDEDGPLEPTKTQSELLTPMPRAQLVLMSRSLEELIPADHPVRLVDEILAQLDWTAWEAACHGSHGQPPIHPSILAKVLLFSMIRRIRSSRQIEYELKHSAAFNLKKLLSRWTELRAAFDVPRAQPTS